MLPAAERDLLHRFLGYNPEPPTRVEVEVGRWWLVRLVAPENDGTAPGFYFSFRPPSPLIPVSGDRPEAGLAGKILPDKKDDLGHVRDRFRWPLFAPDLERAICPQSLKMTVFHRCIPRLNGVAQQPPRVVALIRRAG